MKLRYFLSVSLLAVLLAGCGGGGSAGTLSTSDVAVVSGQHVAKTTFDDVMNEQKLALEAQGQSFPKAGSTQYASLRAQVIGVLVQNAMFAAEAKKLGVSVTDAAVEKEVAAIKKKLGSEKKYQDALKAQGFTDASLREQIKASLLSNALYAKVTANVTAGPNDVQAYCTANATACAPTRAVQEILVGKNKKALAQQIYGQIKGGADFAALAKKYSQDPGSKNIGGQFTARKGQDVPEFDAAVFSSAKAGTLLSPVNTTQYGWFVIKLVGATSTTSDSTVTSAAENSKKQQVMTDWVTNLTKSYCNGGKIKYQAGYAPSPDPCAALATATNTATTG